MEYFAMGRGSGSNSIYPFYDYIEYCKLRRGFHGKWWLYYDEVLHAFVIGPLEGYNG